MKESLNVVQFFNVCSKEQNSLDDILEYVREAQTRRINISQAITRYAFASIIRIHFTGNYQATIKNFFYGHLFPYNAKHLFSLRCFKV